MGSDSGGRFTSSASYIASMLGASSSVLFIGSVFATSTSVFVVISVFGSLTSSVLSTIVCDRVVTVKGF